jgi:phage-related protein
VAKDTELKVVILLEDKASKGLKAVGSSLKGMAATTGKAAAVGLTAVAGGLAAVGGAAIALARDAAPLQGVEDAFYGIADAAGIGGDAMKSALQEGSAGMITNRDLMMSFNKAAQLVSVDFAQQLPDAMQYLGKVAQATGQDMGFMMDSLVTGVGRMSPMILDNLGIQVSLSEAMDRAAEMTGKQASALSKAEQQAGLMSVVLEKLEKNTAAMPDVAGSATQAFASFETTLKNTKDQIGQALLPAITPLMGKIGELAATWLPKVGDAITKVMDRVGELADIFFAVQDPIDGLKYVLMEVFGPEIAGPFQEIADKVIAVKDAFVEFFDSVSTGEDIGGDFYNLTWRLGQAFGMTSEAAAGLADKVEVIVDAIVNAVAPVVAFVSEFVTWKDVLIAAGIGLASILIPAIIGLVAAFAPVILAVGGMIAVVALLRNAWENNWGGIQEKVGAVIAFITNVIQTGLSFIQEFWAAHGEQILATMTMAWQAIQSIIQSVITIITTIIQAAAQFIMEIWNKHGDQIKAYLQALWDAIVTVIQSAITIIQNVFAAFSALFQGDWQALGDALQAIWDALWAAIKSVFEAAKAALELAFGVLSTVLQNLWDTLKLKLEEIWQAAWDSIKQKFETARTTLRNIATNIVERIKGAFDIDWGAIGRAIIEGVKNAILKGIPKLISAAKKAAKKAFQAFMKKLGASRVSRLFKEGGHAMMRGVEAGINEKRRWADLALEKAADGLTGVFKSSLAANSPALLRVWEKMWASIDKSNWRTLSKLGANYEDFFEMMKQEFQAGRVFIGKEWVNLSDYLISVSGLTRDEVVALFDEMGLRLGNSMDDTGRRVTDHWSNYMHGMTDLTRRGFADMNRTIDVSLDEVNRKFGIALDEITDFWKAAYDYYSGFPGSGGVFTLPPLDTPPPSGGGDYYQGTHDRSRPGPTGYETTYYTDPSGDVYANPVNLNTLVINTNAEIRSDVSELILMRAWAGG